MARKILFGLLIIALALGAFLPKEQAQAAAKKGYFTLSIANEIKADDIGYPANYQFVFSIYKEGPLYRQFLLRRGQRVDTQLPSGWYSFTLSNREGKVLAKTRVYYVAPYSRVRWQSNLGPPDLKPTIKLKF
jgi:hypothetical protein